MTVNIHRKVGVVNTQPVTFADAVIVLVFRLDAANCEMKGTFDCVLLSESTSSFVIPPGNGLSWWGTGAGTVTDRRSGFDVRIAGVGLAAAGGSAEVSRDAVI